MHDLVTTVLDVGALLGFAAGVFFAAEPAIGGAALIPASVVVAGVSAFWSWRSRPRDGVKS